MTSLGPVRTHFLVPSPDHCNICSMITLSESIELIASPRADHFMRWVESFLLIFSSDQTINPSIIFEILEVNINEIFMLRELVFPGQTRSSLWCFDSSGWPPLKLVQHSLILVSLIGPELSCDSNTRLWLAQTGATLSHSRLTAPSRQGLNDHYKRY